MKLQSNASKAASNVNNTTKTNKIFFQNILLNLNECMDGPFIQKMYARACTAAMAWELVTDLFDNA